MKRTLQKSDLVDLLRQGSVDQTRLLMMHSSLHSLGRVDGGAETVIDAVLEVLGEDGTLMVPTFNYVLETDVFDPATVHSQTGLITNTLRKRPEAVRSLHPTYSVAAIGRQAEEFTREHWNAESVGIDSPIDRIARAGGFILLLGVKHDTDSTMHVGESYAQAPYRGVPYDPNFPRTARVRTPSGEVVTVDLNDEPGCSTGFGVIEMPLRQRGLIRDFKIEAAKCQLLRGLDVIETTVEVLKERSDALLCSNPACYFCTHARKKTARHPRSGE